MMNCFPRRNFNTSTFTFSGSELYSEFYSVENGDDYRYVIDINPAIVSVPLSKRVIDNLTKARRYARGQEKARFSGKLQAFQEHVEARLQ